MILSTDFIFIVMYGLIQTVYNQRKQQLFEDLYSDADVPDQFLLRRTLAQALKDCPAVIPSHGTDWVLCMLTQYEKSEEDTVRVFQAVMKYVGKPLAVGMVNEKIKMRSASDIADSCMVGIGLFREYLERMHQHRAAPSVDYYTQLGSVTFHKLGFDDIADNFCGWTEFLEKELTL